MDKVLSARFVKSNPTVLKNILRQVVMKVLGRQCQWSMLMPLKK